mgnify:FL=1
MENSSQSRDEQLNIRTGSVAKFSKKSILV